MGSDRTIINAARVSFNKDQESITEERLKGMIRFMMKNKHGSVFEHCVITFVIKAPLFVIREWHRHRTQSYNEWSGRYSQLEPEFYVPEFVRTQVGKPGAYTFEPISDKAEAQVVRNKITSTSLMAYGAYVKMLEQGVAKEQARLVIPVNTYSKFYATANLRNWMRFLELRNSEHAMFEIRQYAQSIEEMLTALYPECMQAFIDNGRVAP
jgi:thymidylate synthase (FAD)